MCSSTVGLMTTAAALTVTPTSGVVFGLAALGRGVDELAAAVARASTVGRGDLQGVERLIRRLESVKLAMIAAVDRDRIAARVGSANTAAWVAESTKTGGGVAAGEVALATALDAELPATRAALADGVLSTRHAAIIATTMRSLPEDLTHADRATVEAKLVRDAKHLEPARLRKAATLALAAAEKTAAEVAAHQEQVLLDQERRAYARATLTMFDHGDGTTTGKFLVPTGAAMVLRKVIDSMTAPRPATTTTTAPPRPNPAAPSAPPPPRPRLQAPARAPAQPRTQAQAQAQAQARSMETAATQGPASYHQTRHLRALESGPTPGPASCH